MHRLVYVMTILCAATLVTAGCSEDPQPGFEPGTYASSHRAAIEVDCDKRVMCAERTNEFLRSDAFEDCVTRQAMNLNANEDLRLKFQLGIRRCPNNDTCHYVACVDSGFQSFGEAQVDKVHYACQQKLQCQIDTGMIAGDRQTIYDSCVLWSILALDEYQSEARSEYQTSFFQCMPATSCAFLECFPY